MYFTETKHTFFRFIFETKIRYNLLYCSHIKHLYTIRELVKLSKGRRIHSLEPILKENWDFTCNLPLSLS